MHALIFWHAAAQVPGSKPPPPPLPLPPTPPAPPIPPVPPLPPPGPAPQSDARNSTPMPSVGTPCSQHVSCVPSSEHSRCSPACERQLHTVPSCVPTQPSPVSI